MWLKQTKKKVSCHSIGGVEASELKMTDYVMPGWDSAREFLIQTSQQIIHHPGKNNNSQNTLL